MSHLLLYAAAGSQGSDATRWALALAGRLGARVFALHSIALPADQHRGAVADRDKELEEEAWRVLYEVEDDAFALDVRLSLLLEKGDQMNRLVEAGEMYSADMIIVPADVFDPATLIALSRSPVVFVRTLKEEA